MSRWRGKFGGMTVSEAQEKRRLDEANRKLRGLVAQFALEGDTLKLALGKKVVTISARREVVRFAKSRGHRERRACALVVCSVRLPLRASSARSGRPGRAAARAGFGASSLRLTVACMRRFGARAVESTASSSIACTAAGGSR